MQKREQDKQNTVSAVERAGGFNIEPENNKNNHTEPLFDHLLITPNKEDFNKDNPINANAFKKVAGATTKKEPEQKTDSGQINKIPIQKTFAGQNNSQAIKQNLADQYREQIM